MKKDRIDFTYEELANEFEKTYGKKFLFFGHESGMATYCLAAILRRIGEKTSWKHFAGIWFEYLPFVYDEDLREFIINKLKPLVIEYYEIHGHYPLNEVYIQRILKS